MAYGNRRRFKRRTAVRRTGVGRRSSKMRYVKKYPVSRKYIRFAKTLSRFRENKVAINTLNQNITSSGAGITFAPLTQGTTRSTRTGNKIFIKSFTIKGWIYQGGSGAVLVRHAFIWPKPGTGQVIPPINSEYASFDTDLYGYLWDKIAQLGKPQATSAINTALPSFKKINYTVRINKTFTYDDNNPIPNEPTPYLFLWCNAIFQPNGPNMSYNCSTYLSFQDM